MKRALVAALLVALCLGLALPAAAQEDVKFKMESYWVILAERGPTWTPQSDERGMEIRMQVVQNLRQLITNDHSAIIAGLVTDNSGAEFIVIAQTEDEWAMRDQLNKAPNVANGFYNLRIISFRGPAGLKLEAIPR
jgi:uncharacterized membrane-anchored protein